MTLEDSQQSIESSKPRATELPDLRLGLYLWSLVIDHELRKNTLYFHPNCPLDLQQKIRTLLTEKPKISDTGLALKETLLSQRLAKIDISTPLAK